MISAVEAAFQTDQMVNGIETDDLVFAILQKAERIVEAKINYQEYQAEISTIHNFDITRINQADLKKAFSVALDRLILLGYKVLNKTETTATISWEHLKSVDDSSLVVYNTHKYYA